MSLIGKFLKKYLLLSFLFVVFLYPVLSCADEIDEFIEEIQTSSSKIHSFSSNFIQEKHLALFAEPVLFHGNLFVAKPSRLRWEFTSPMKSVLILNDSVGMRCDEKAQESRFDLTTDPLMRSVAEQLWLWLGGDYKKLKTQFSLEKVGKHTLRVSPLKKSVSDYVESVKIQFDPIAHHPQVVEITEPGGDLTRISFTSYTAHQKVSDSLFSKCTLHE